MTDLRALLAHRGGLSALAAASCFLVLVAGISGEEKPSKAGKPENTQAETIPLLTEEQALGKLKLSRIHL